MGVVYVHDILSLINCLRSRWAPGRRWDIARRFRRNPANTANHVSSSCNKKKCAQSRKAHASVSPVSINYCSRSPWLLQSTVAANFSRLRTQCSMLWPSLCFCLSGSCLSRQRRDSPVLNLALIQDTSISRRSQYSTELLAHRIGSTQLSLSGQSVSAQPSWVYQANQFRPNRVGFVRPITLSTHLNSEI